ncbi:unnamed protein product [Nippostrongylus brasiliensis]|uniref:Reverse transcriptase domain-containing protein n=1 Tax=Nippostrongylus brasiliensis TaxID=27835 RepID=A0A0N4XR75_NIPBR|nr:unnamed protein product [Nippostrongylus brasiliensis]
MPALRRPGIVKPIFKKGRKNLDENYCSMCLTSGVSEVMERFTSKALINYIRLDAIVHHTNAIVHPTQHGFLKNKSITTVSAWRKGVNSNGYITERFVDYSKAFDSLQIIILYLKLGTCEITGFLAQLIQAFLIDRSQQVVINRTSSKVYHIPSGVPEETCIA